jgi:DNA-binding NarL/FixJ family response regulator
MDPNHLIRVLIAEDDEGIREVLASVVRSEPALALVAAVEDANGAVDAAALELPDVALVDVRMPGGGVSAARGIKLCSPGTSVLAFSAHDDALTMQAMYDAGADGYVVKGSTVSEIIGSIMRAAAGAATVPRAA